MLFATPYAKTLAAEKGVDLKVCFGVCYCFCCCEKDVDLKVCLAYVVTLLLTVFVHMSGTFRDRYCFIHSKLLAVVQRYVVHCAPLFVHSKCLAVVQRARFEPRMY